MKAYFQDKDKEVLYVIEDANIIPNVGEDVLISDTWYTVESRDFFLKTDRHDSVTLWVKEYKADEE